MKKLILLSIILIVGCEELLESTKEGCTHPTACNYDADATQEDESCVDPQGCNEWCEGDTTTVHVMDCIGVCEGTAAIDSCGVCSGGTTGLGVDYLKDECGICGGDNSTCSGCIDIYALNYDNSAIINADCNYADHTIDITDNGISPFILEILTGESVQWNNKTSQQVGINGDIAEINYDLNSDGFIDIFIGEPLNASDHTFYLSERGQGVIGSLLFDSAWWYSYDCIQESCVIDNAETIEEDCIEYQNTSLDELSIICMPLIVVITND